MAIMESQPPVNLVRSIFLCNIFNFFLSASKACLLPFLTLYLKKLGISATQVGFIICAKTVVGLVFAPLWSMCAVRCGKRRFVLMFSLLVMAATYLSLTAVPSFDKSQFISKCVQNPTFNESQWTTSNDAQFGKEFQGNASVNSNESHNVKASEIPVLPVTTPKPAEQSTSPKTSLNEASPDTKSTTAAPTPETATSTLSDITPSPKREDVTSEPNMQLNAVLQEILIAVGIPEKSVKKMSTDHMSTLISSLMDSKKDRHILDEALEKLSPEAIQTLQDMTARKRRDVADSGTNVDKNAGNASGSSEPSWKVWTKKLFKEIVRVRDQLIETEFHMFVVVLVVLMVGEAFCSPIEKIADDGWFEFLESIDDLEKYGMQKIWSTFAYILFPFIVTLAVDNTDCLFGMTVHPFMLHFYLFGAVLGVTFIIALFYPMTISDKYKYASKVGKGMRQICCSGRSLMLTLTLLLMGIVYASYYNFLFWLLDDLHSGEFTMGMCLTLAALSEVPMLLFSEKLVKKIGNGGVVALSLLFLSLRCLYYSFLTTPWAVLPAELCHAFTHTAMWWAILSSSSFNTSPVLSRSIRSILSSVYFGVGFATGSLVSGIVYDIYGKAILFQAGAVLSIAWFMVASVGLRCCREKDRSQVKYSRLLNSDQSDTDSAEDDWLEHALKDR